MMKDKADTVRVYSRNGKEFGCVIGEGAPYTGEAGYSERAIVVWANGSITKPLYRGMKPYPGDERHWQII